MSSRLMAYPRRRVLEELQLLLRDCPGRSENGVRFAQKIQVGPCIPAGIQLGKA
jgi:hypothetical protein